MASMVESDINGCNLCDIINLDPVADYSLVNIGKYVSVLLSTEQINS